MPMFATVAEFEDWVGDGVFDATETAQATTILTVVSGAIAGYLGQGIEAVTDDVVVLDGNGTGILELPQFPVTDVTSVVVNAVTLVNGTDYTWNSAGILTLLRWLPSSAAYPGFFSWSPVSYLTPRWPTVPRLVTVTYDHGWATVPGDIKALTLQIADRLRANPGGASRESVAGVYEIQHGTSTAAAALLTAEERAVLHRHRSPLVG